MSNLKYILIIVVLGSLFSFKELNQTVKSKNCKLSFQVPSDWKVEDLNVVEDDFEDEDFKINIKIKNYIQGYDLLECISTKEREERIMGVFIYKDGVLNTTQISYEGVTFQSVGNGQKFELNNIEWTSILKDKNPVGYEDYSVYQFTARIKKVNVLIFGFFPTSMDVNEETKQIKDILGSFESY